MTDRTKEWSAGIHALMWAKYNVSTDTVMSWVYDLDRCHSEYLDPKKRIWESSPLAFFGQLDQDRTRRFVEALRARYESDLSSERYYDLTLTK